MTSKTYVHHFKHKSFDKRFDNKKEERLEMYRQINKRFYTKWKKVMQEFLNKEQLSGKDVVQLMSKEDNYDYWFLRRLNENIGFWKGGKLVDFTI